MQPAGFNLNLASVDDGKQSAFNYGTKVTMT